MKIEDLLRELDQHEMPEIPRVKSVELMAFVQEEGLFDVEKNNLFDSDPKVNTMALRRAVSDERGQTEARQRGFGGTRFRGTKRITYAASASKDEPESFIGFTAKRDLTTKSGPTAKPEINYPTLSPFIERLVQIIESVGYENVEIQSIERQETTRVPFSVINFTFGSEDKLIPRQWLIKDFHGYEHVRDKDILIPAFMSELKVPTGKIVGFDYETMKFDHRFALIDPCLPANGVWFDPIGESDYKSIVPKLNQRTLVKS